MKKMMLIISLILLAILFAGTLIYAIFIEPNRLTLTQISVPTKVKKPTKIVALSDFHFGKNERSRGEKIVQKTLKLRPDAVCLLGDYANRHSEKNSIPLDEICEILSAFPRAGMPTFAVLGNHDAFVGRQIFAEKLRSRGIVVFEEKDLRLQTLGNGEKIVFAGTLDPHSFYEIFDKNCVPENPFPQFPCVLLSHSPDVAPFLNSSIDLALCGHTHGGQICLPFGVPVVSSTIAVGHEFSYGLREIPSTGTRIFITRGLGQSIVPARLFCPPEIVEILLVPAAGTR